MTKNQQFILTYYLAKASFFGLGISKLFNTSYSYTPLSSLIGFILGFILLYYITKKDLTKLYNNIFTKLLILFLAIVILNNSVLAFTNLSANFYLSKTPPIILIIPLFLLIFYGVKKGINTISRLGEYLFIVSIILIFIISITSLFNIKLTNIIITNYNTYNFIKSIIMTIVYGVSPIILLLTLTDNIDQKSILKGYILGSLIILDSIINTIGILGLTLTNLYHYPEYIVLKKLTILSFLEKFENIFAFKWFIDLFMLCLICACAINKIIGSKLILIFGFILILLTYFFFINNYQNTLIIYNISYLLMLFPSIILTLTSKKRSNLSKIS